VRAERDVAAEPLGARDRVLPGVQDEPAPGLHRPAAVHADPARDAAVVEAELPEQRAEPHLGSGAIDHEPERAARVVANHVDHGAREGRAVEPLGGDEKLPGEGRAHPAPRRGWRGARRRRDERDQGQRAQERAEGDGNDPGHP
jgi:hypothetical protein